MKIRFNLPLRDRVYQDCNNVYEKGYTEILMYTPERLAEDLYNYADYGDVCRTVKDILIAHVISWQQSKKAELYNG